jgi:hypothetical protein
LTALGSTKTGFSLRLKVAFGKRTLIGSSRLFLCCLGVTNSVVLEETEGTGFVLVHLIAMSDGVSTPAEGLVLMPKCSIRGNLMPRLAHGWVPIVALPMMVMTMFPSNWPRWCLMWTLAFAIYVGCKWLTWRRTFAPRSPVWKHIGYLLAWPGMDAATFLNTPSNTVLNTCSYFEWLFALAKLASGILLIWGLAPMVAQHYVYLAGWIGMVGIVMTLHFGLFHLLSCWWRSIQVDAQPLMNWPLKSRNISEFWGCRWNTAFRDLTHRFIFKPLATYVNTKLAILGGFLVSGLIHELVISVPARGGYGGPTLFFLLQGGAILFTRSSIARKIGLRSGWLGWTFALFSLLLPLFFLFHPPFVIEVIVPLMKVAGAIR